MAYDPDNIFALILRGDAPAIKVEEDEHTLSFMDIMPQSEGHTLIVPKEPAEDILAISPEALAQVTRQTHRIAHAVERAFEPDGIMIAQLNRAAAGQTVFHLHFHVIPRWGAADLAFHARQMADMETLETHAEKIRNALKDIDS